MARAGRLQAVRDLEGRDGAGRVPERVGHEGRFERELHRLALGKRARVEATQQRPRLGRALAATGQARGLQQQ